MKKILSLFVLALTVTALLDSGTAYALECPVLQSALKEQMLLRTAMRDYFRIQIKMVDSKNAAPLIAFRDQNVEILKELVEVESIGLLSQNGAYNFFISRSVKNESKDKRTDSCAERLRQTKEAVPFLKLSDLPREAVTIFYELQLDRSGY